MLCRISILNVRRVYLLAIELIFVCDIPIEFSRLLFKLTVCVHILNGKGVETVKIDGAASKCAVTGKVDPVKLRDKLEEKTHKKVELLTPVPKKEKENTKNKDEPGDAKDDKKKEKEKPKDKNSNEKNKKDEEKNAKQVQILQYCSRYHAHVCFFFLFLPSVPVTLLQVILCYFVVFVNHMTQNSSLHIVRLESAVNTKIIVPH